MQAAENHPWRLAPCWAWALELWGKFGAPNHPKPKPTPPPPKKKRGGWLLWVVKNKKSLRKKNKNAKFWYIFSPKYQNVQKGTVIVLGACILCPWRNSVYQDYTNKIAFNLRLQMENGAYRKKCAFVPLKHQGSSKIAMCECFRNLSKWVSMFGAMTYVQLQD